ncbi:MAG: hypothetical protein M0R70_13055 [Nitrospirae bacterium]|nr:hypothetical protein [Nitrospirota bacterium]
MLMKIECLILRRFEIKRNILLAVVLLFSFSCAPSIPYTVKESLQAGFPTPSNDKATVVFVRPDFYALDVPFALYDDEKIIGVVKGLKNCTITQVSAGKHIFAVLTLQKTGILGAGRDRYMFIDAELANGKIYYIYVRPYGIFSAGFFSDLEPVKENNEYWNKLPEWLYDCTLTEINNETHEWDLETAKVHKRERDEDYKDWLQDKERQRKAIKPEDGLTAPVIPKKSRG